MSAFSAHATRPSLPTLHRASADDAAAVSSFLQGLNATSRRLRFHGHCNPRSQALALQMCQVDGVRHQAWLAWVGHGDQATVVGEARFVMASDAEGGAGVAELAMAVADDWQGCGLADALMQQVLSAAREAGVGNLYGDVLDGNTRMAAFMHRHGFEVDLWARGDVLRMRRVPSASQPRAGGVMARVLNTLLAMPLSLRGAGVAARAGAVRR